MGAVHHPCTCRRCSAHGQACCSHPCSVRQTHDTKADVNKDGKLDKMEAEGIPGLGARFDQVDADGDKLVSKVELEKAMKP
jgi:EF hand